MYDARRNSLRRKIERKIQRMPPGLVVALSFLMTATIGAVLLALPAATKGDSLGGLDSFFTAISAVCVTGLVVIDIGAKLTLFGKIVVLTLIQIGGLGIMTFSVFLFLFIGKSLGTKEKWIISDSFLPSPIVDIGQLIRMIFVFTFTVEMAGAVLLFLVWRREMPLEPAIFSSVFHAVSSFCNAGFSFFSTSFIKYQGNILLNVTVMSLIVLGGLGFPVVYEFYWRFRNRKDRRRYHFSLHTKLVLYTTAFLIIGGALLIFFIERGPEWEILSLKNRTLASLFQSVTARTAGFNTVEISALEPATLFIIIMLMFIGASPGSTGGGIKTTTLAVFVAIIRSRMAGRQSIGVFRFAIPDGKIGRALSVLVMAVMTVSAGLILLLVFHMDIAQESADYFLSALFETVSAFATVGLSMGATTSLNPAGKIVIIVLMFLGRVGLLTMAYVVTSRLRPITYRYADGRIMIG
ncbi:MAG: potassium transporter [Candidatus Krumholzibacteria bacterium]|nr:potassium transporter [Candidatus Krumholzibacteria bacterium]